MSGTRQQQRPWLADHVIFFSYRWMAWLVAGVLAFWRGVALSYAPLLAALALVAVLTTLFAQQYFRAAQRNPAIMTLDIVVAAVVLALSEGWQGHFVLYATSSLVAPALLFGWRGGLMAGLAFVALDQGASWANGRSPATQLEEGQYLAFAASMIVPPVFGVAFPWLIDLIRRLAHQQSRQRARRRPPATSANLTRDTRADPLNRFAAAAGDESGRGVAEEALFPVRSTAVRPVEQSTEDLRRVIFAPFPSADLELHGVLDWLATRYGEHTGAGTRVTLMGRTRAIHPAHRAVLVRLSQEALLNIQQHAHAHQVDVTLRYDAHSVVLLIQDDGVGLLDGTYERPGLHALRAMNYRLNELGGRLDVFETEGGGVAVRASMPLE